MNRTVFISDEKIAFSYKHENHRLNGPAIIYYDGEESWYKHGRRHRIGGPAVIYYDGSESWWKNGKHLFSNDMA